MEDSPDPRVDAVIVRMRELYQAFTQQHEQAWIHTDLSLAQIKAFFVIAREGEPSVGLVAKELHIGLPSASHVVDRLVRAGLVERRPHPGDRRVTQCVLSIQGQEARSRAEAGPDVLRSWLQGMSVDKLQALADGLAALVNEAGRHQGKGEDVHGRESGDHREGG